MSKTLFILTSDCGDGSRGIHFTMDIDWIKNREEAYDKGELDYDSVGVDGDGFSYSTIQVPDDATYESLGIHFPLEFEDE